MPTVYQTENRKRENERMKMLVHEMLDEVKTQPTRETKIMAIRKYYHDYGFVQVLERTFAPYYQYVFDKPVPYKPDTLTPAGMGFTSIVKELPRTYLFEKNNPKVAPNLSLERKTILLIQMLEAMEAREAEVFMNMFLKKQDGLDVDLVNEALPGLIKGYTNSVSPDGPKVTIPQLQNDVVVISGEKSA